MLRGPRGERKIFAICGSFNLAVGIWGGLVCAIIPFVSAPEVGLL